MECGRYLSSEATNAYLKLLLRILTPSPFGKKIASFWERDNRNGGNFDPAETVLGENYVRLKMVGAEGFDHGAPVTAGFCSLVLDAMEKKNIDVQQGGWSLETPGPSSYVVEPRWDPSSVRGRRAARGLCAGSGPRRPVLACAPRRSVPYAPMASGHV